MRVGITASVMALLLAVLAGCGEAEAPVSTAPLDSSRPAEPVADADSTQTPPVATPANEPAPSAVGPTPKPGGGFIAEESGVEGTLAINIRWSAKIVSGIPQEGLKTVVYNRRTQLLCPVTSSDEAAYSYFAAFDNPNGDVFAATGAYQPWWNEECTGSLTIEDSYHQDDPTILGPEPTVHTTGTRPLSTGDTPLTVETDLNRGRTRYLFVTPSADGFQQEAVEGYEEAKLVPASAVPMATMDMTLEGPIGSGQHEFAVEGGIVQVDWTFTRQSIKP